MTQVVSFECYRWYHLSDIINEGINIARTLAVEAEEGAEAVLDYQLKH